MQKLGMQEGEAIEHPWVNKAIENAQRKVEGHNFDIRKNLLEYDDVANDQRKVVYSQRAELMASDDISETIKAIREDVVNEEINNYIPPESLEEMWDVPGLERAMEAEFNLAIPVQQWLDEDDNLHEEILRKRIVEALEQAYYEKEAQAGKSVMRHFEKAVMLKVLDEQWKEHLGIMDHLRQGIHLRGYAQKNPKQEYKREAFELFTQMLDRVKQQAVEVLSRVQVQAEDDVAAIEEQRRSQAPVSYRHDELPSAAAAPAEEEAAETEHQPFVREGRKVGRNEPCPCGSGKKYKQCHGRLA
jgi:preprotein translocase subunit SecA